MFCRVNDDIMVLELLEILTHAIVALMSWLHTFHTWHPPESVRVSLLSFQYCQSFLRLRGDVEVAQVLSSTRQFSSCSPRVLTLMPSCDLVLTSPVNNLLALFPA
eukprot:2473914-Amphidinium_carterae.1